MKENLNLTFKKLTPNLAEDYLYYFDNVAFSNNDEFSLCYCLESHLTADQDKSYKTRETRRNKALELIKNGIMQGYLVYLDEKPVAWCNVGDKTTYCSMMDSEHNSVDLTKEKVKAIYCMDIAPAYRGMGIANRVLEKVLEDAKAQGYSYVEGYPFSDDKFPYQFHGPVHMYLKHDFKKIAEKSNFFIMSKKL